MSVYKVIQDIEAEDKLLGPLGLRQFIYAAIAISTGFVAFRLILVKWFLGLPLIPFTAVFGILAFPFGKDQPTEIWLLAKVRFFLKPHRRIWDQSGMKHLVTITAPPKIERHLTKDLTQAQVQSRLKALSSTLDSRGWAVKNVNVNLNSQPDYYATASDRLISPAQLPQEVPTVGGDIAASDDILDEQNNPVASQVDQMINASSQEHREQLLEQIKQRAAPGGQQTDGQWFMNEADVSATLKAKKESVKPVNGNVVQPLDAKHQIKTTKKAAKPDAGQAKAEMTDTSGTDILKRELAFNDDLDVATLSRQVNKADQPPEDGEVVIPLH